jgi:hypothetical protein
MIYVMIPWYILSSCLFPALERYCCFVSLMTHMVLLDDLRHRSALDHAGVLTGMAWRAHPKKGIAAG